MKILTLTKFFHPTVGGMETVVKNITDSNLRQGHQSDVLCSNDTFTLRNIVYDNKVRIIKSPQLVRIKSTSICPFMPWHLKSFLKKDYDVIHAHFPDPMTALSLFLCRPETPLVIHWHSDVIKQRQLMSFYGPLQKWCLDVSRRVIVTSTDYMESSPELWPYRHKVKIIPIGIESPNHLAPKERGDRLQILSVGRLTEYKGFQFLIEAASYLPEHYQVKIVGDGYLREKLQNLIDERGLRDRVVLLGNRSTQELSELYRSSDLFCLPSINRSEAFGVVLLEAMSYGLPIVTSNILGSGVPWVNQHQVTGLNVFPGSAEKIAIAVRQILEFPEVEREFSQNALTRVKTEFSLKKMMKEIWDVYNNL